MKKLLLIPIIAGLVTGAYLALLGHVRQAPATVVSVTPDLVIQGGQVRVSQPGFFPLEPVDIRVSSKENGPADVDVREAQATIGGSLEATSVVLPDSVPSGAHVLQVTGTISGRGSTVTVYLRAPAPWLTVDGNVRPVGSFGLIVGGFNPGERILVTMVPVPPKTTASPLAIAKPAAALGDMPTDRVGNSLYTTLKVPFREPGDYDVVTVGETSGQKLQKRVSLAPYQPTFDLSPWFGPPGLKVELNARGYAPGERVDIFLGGSRTAAVTVRADNYGNLWGAGKVTVPYALTSGPLDVKAVGEESGVSTTRQFAIQKPKPWLELTTYYGAPTAPVAFSGGGWAAGENITFHLTSSRNSVIARAQADGYGWLHDAGPVYIPRDAGDQVIFVATGDRSHTIASATFTVVYPFGMHPTN